MTTSRRVRPFAPAAAALSAAVILALPAHGLWEAAEGEIFLLLDASVAADSNIAANSLELSDTIYSVTPGFSWERSRGRGSVSLSGACQIERASEYEGYDSENYSADFSLQMPVTAGRRLQGGITASYFNGSRIDSFQNTRISETSWDFGIDGSYQVSNKVNARASASYGFTDPETLAYYESTAFTVGAGYNFRPEISFFVDARFTESSSSNSALISGGTDTSGNAILVGIDGQITQKLSGSIGFGYDWSESDNGGAITEYSGPTYDIGLNWAPRERTSVSLNASNGVQSSSTGSTEYIRVNLTVSQEIGLNWSADAGVSYRSSDFAVSTRGNDDVWEGNVGVSYAFTRQVSMALSYTYTNSDSSSAIVDYTRSVWALSASARF